MVAHAIDEKPLILFVDDELEQRNFAEKALKAMGYNVLLAEDGKQALDFLNIHPEIKVVIIDFNMPRMNGLQLLEELKSHHPLIKSILITASTELWVAQKALNDGKVLAYFGKPWKPREVQTKIQEAISLYDSQIKANMNEEVVKEKMKSDFKVKMLIDRAVHMGCIKDYSNIKFHLKQMELVGGDMILTAKLPNNKLRIWVGDVTNHGIHAALVARDVALNFYALHKENPSIDKEVLLRAVNKDFKIKMAANYFCCTAFVEIDFENKCADIWLASIPEVYIRRNDGSITQVSSKQTALGTKADEAFDTSFQTVQFESGDQLYLWTDGIFETKNSAGELYGTQALMQTFESNQNPETLFQAILDDCREFLGLGDVEDDMTLVEVKF